MIEYTQVDENGIVVRSRYTTNPEAAIPDGHRLLKDVSPIWDSMTENCLRVEPIPSNAIEIPYVIVPIERTEEELAWNARELRNQLLQESDRTQLLDNNLNEEKRKEWATYRQLLRDVPQQNEFPHTINWPTKP